MPAPAWDDLRNFFDPDVFGSRGIIRFQAGGERQILGIFDDPYMNTMLGEYEADTSSPRFTCCASDVAGVQRGDEFELDGVMYDVMTFPQKDGHGLAILKLAPQGRP